MSAVIVVYCVDTSDAKAAVQELLSKGWQLYDEFAYNGSEYQILYDPYEDDEDDEDPGH